jgi:hypothetical protein
LKNDPWLIAVMNPASPACALAPKISFKITQPIHNPKSGSCGIDFHPARHRFSGLGCQDQVGR